MALLKWFEEFDRQTPGLLMDGLQKLATIDVALIGGCLIGLKGDVVPPAWRLVVVALLIGSLVCSLAGIRPRGHVVNSLSSQAIKEFKERLVERRGLWLSRGVQALAMAFAAALAGMFVRVVW